jgi:hypothetical protein
VRTRVLAVIAVAVLAARPLAAQGLRFQGADAGLSRVVLQSATSEGDQRLSGIVLAGRARAAIGRFVVALAYSQGRMSADSGPAADRDLVDGSLLVSMRPVPWLTVETGPHARAYVTSLGGTERWMFWQVGARAEQAVIPGLLQVHAELWLALASSVNVAAGSGGARGGEVGLTIRAPGSPLFGRLGYVVDQAKLSGGVRTETVERVIISVGLSRR